MKKILAIGSNHFYQEGGFIYAIDIAKALKAELHLLYVIDTHHGYLIDTTLRTSELGRDARKELKKLEIKTLRKEGKERLSKIRGICRDKGVSCKPEIVKGNTKKVLFRRTKDYDIAVIGFRRVGKLRELLVGTETDKIVENCQCPLLIVKDTNPIENILVAGDNNFYSKKTIRYAIRLSSGTNAKLSGLYVIDTTTPYVAVSKIGKDELGEDPRREMRKIVLNELKEEGRERLKLLEEICERKGINFKDILKTGKPMRIALDTVDKESPNLLIMAHKKIKRRYRFLLKSELEEVIERVPCSLLIVR